MAAEFGFGRAKSPFSGSTACIRLGAIGFEGSAELKASSGLTSRRRVLGRIDAPQVARAFAVLGIFADRHVHAAVVNHRRANDVVPRGADSDCSATSSDCSRTSTAASSCLCRRPRGRSCRANRRRRRKSPAARRPARRRPATTIGRAGYSGRASYRSTARSCVFLSMAKKLGACGIGM